MPPELSEQQKPTPAMDVYATVADAGVKVRRSLLRWRFTLGIDYDLWTIRCYVVYSKFLFR